MGEFNQTKYINEYNKEKYDIIRVPFPKGYKETLKIKSKEKGFNSISGYIKDLVETDIHSKDEKIIGGGTAPLETGNKEK